MFYHHLGAVVNGADCRTPAWPHGALHFAWLLAKRNGCGAVKDRSRAHNLVALRELEIQR